MEVFKKLHINIPFVDALEQMPSHVQFMKDILSKNRRLSNFETINLTECHFSEEATTKAKRPK